MAPEGARATLLEDAGAAAESEEFFRSRAFFDAEGVSHALVLEDPEGRVLRAGAGVARTGARVAIPLVARATPDGAHLDAVSPYGYPGGALGGVARTHSKSRGATDASVLSPDGVDDRPLTERMPIEPAEVDWSATGLVSVFIRERIGGEPCLAGATNRAAVQVSDPELPRKSRMSDRQQIRRNEAAGYSVDSRPGPEASQDEIAGLTEVYGETMARTAATERYLYDESWFAKVLGSERSWLFLARAPDATVAAAALAVSSDDILHYYLSGTAEAHHRASPSKNLILAVTEFAEGRGELMNLGGGLAPGDSLEEFKKGFANRELPFHTHELVCDPAAYATLSGDRPDSDFFPLYRAPE